MLLSGRDMEVGITDIGRDIRVFPDVFPVVSEETATMPMSLSVVVETGPQFDCDTDILLSGRDVEVEITDIGRDIRVFPDLFPVMFDETAAVPLSLPVVVVTAPLVDCDTDILLSERDVGSEDYGYRSGYPTFAGRVSGDV